MDLTGQHSLYCFNQFICGGLCHLSSYKQSSGLRTAGLSTHTDNKILQYYLINIINIKILSFQFLLF